jgi:hypothetical protein
MSDCPRLGKLFGGCGFEARYDLGPCVATFETIQGVGAGDFMEKYRAKIYRGDVCVRCGKIVNGPLDTKRQISPHQA